jgi:hypothetical protein
MKISLPNNWTPRAYQLSVLDYLSSGGKRAACVWHRRAGKDDVCLHWTAIAAMTRPATYWHMLPEAAQARKAIWEAINPHSGKRRIDEAFPVGIRRNTRDQDMAIRFINGSMWHVVGSDNYNSLVGSPPAGVIFSEWPLGDPGAWGYLRPILAENGGWALFVYTPRGNNHGKTTYELAKKSNEWFNQLLTAEQTGVFSPEQLETERAEYIAQYGMDLGTAMYNQEYLCSFDSPVPGAIFATEIEAIRTSGRLKAGLYDPALPVSTAWDLGMDDSTAIWFIQQGPDAPRAVDYYESSGVGLEHYSDELEKRSKEKGYKYATHIGPHDIEVRELTSGKSRRDTAWEEYGLSFDTADRPKTKPDAIELTRSLLKRLWIDPDACERGLACLSSYRREYSEKNQAFSNNPLHDWASHGADALQTYALWSNRRGGDFLSWL